jgi:hypothetical protein
MRRILLLGLLLGVVAVAVAQPKTREEKVHADRKKFEGDPLWIYNDLPRGFAEAKKTGKPMLVVLRCLPCEECVKLDDDLVNQDPRIRPLLDKYVCVRVVMTNGLDLSLFQFDYDQSFAAFLLNGDGVILGRFGTRSHRTSWSDDVSIEGLARALQGGLELQAQYPKNRAELAGKRGPAADVAAPELLPGLKGKYTPKLTYESKVVQSCIHCHQIGDAYRDQARLRKEPFPEDLLYPHPHPKAVGLIFDPKERATVLDLVEGSPAARAGFRRGDRIAKLHGQPLVSIADVQWVLHQTSPAGATLTAEVQRGNAVHKIDLTLLKGWRQRDDISWRSSAWGLRRMATGGMLLGPLPAADRARLGIAESSMALLANHVGQYGPHAAAQNAGFRKGDILVSFDGRTDLMRESDLIAHGLSTRRPGDKVNVTILRDGT